MNGICWKGFSHPLIIGELFAICPVRAFPGTDVEPVSDSSRYFVLKLEDTSGNAPGVGLTALQHLMYIYRQVNMHLLVWGFQIEAMHLISMLHFKIISS